MNCEIKSIVINYEILFPELKKYDDYSDIENHPVFVYQIYVSKEFRFYFHTLKILLKLTTPFFDIYIFSFKVHCMSSERRF